MNDKWLTSKILTAIDLRFRELGSNIHEVAIKDRFELVDACKNDLGIDPSLDVMEWMRIAVQYSNRTNSIWFNI